MAFRVPANSVRATFLVGHGQAFSCHSRYCSLADDAPGNGICRSHDPIAHLD